MMVGTDEVQETGGPQRAPEEAGGGPDCLEEQYELLNSSLIALTTHFAQVQFRLRQIVDAAPEEKEILLKNLEEFAFRGIPEVDAGATKKRLSIDAARLEETLNQQRAKQSELIDRLKRQLADLESYAYEAGDGGPPQNLIIERQKVIIDRLKDQLNLNVDEIDKMTVEDLKRYVDKAVSEVINPLKMKEQLVLQLKTQLSDLERYIHFLQVDSNEYSSGKKPECKCDCGGCNHDVSRPDQLHGKMINIVRRISALLQIFASTQFHSTRKFYRNSPKKNMKVKHWGDLRAQLELAIENVIELASEPEPYADSDYVSDCESTVHTTTRLSGAVRKQLAVGLQNLMRHGLADADRSIVPFVSCFRPRSLAEIEQPHPWELFLKYYDMKNGDQFNSTPARKLSQSFNLDICGSGAASSKQSLLSTLGNIIATHDAYKKGHDSRFKALVCAGLNCKSLVPWLKLVLRCRPIVETFYTDWSYVAKTGFEDAFASLEKLNRFHFDLPVDHAVRKLNEIKDAF